MRKQYHFRPSPHGYFAWDVLRLIVLSQDLVPADIPLSDIAEIDENFWFSDRDSPPTCRAIVDHLRLMDETDDRYPIILSSDGRLMDGMHRVAKALYEGRETIRAVRFVKDPEPDHVDVMADDLSY